MSVITAKVDNKEFRVEIDSDSKGRINDQSFSFDIKRENEHRIHAIVNKKSYNLEVFNSEAGAKIYRVKVNGSYYEVALSDRYDALLKDLGMEGVQSAQHKDVKAPMPGLVLEIIVVPEQEVSKGDALIILEAMKMENVIKSPVSGKVRQISVNKGQAVEKNQILLEFE
jgi:biotin carboxyl carrier protein